MLSVAPTWVRSIRRVVAIALLVGLLPVSTAGCFGSFNLTRKVYGFNQEVSSDKWIRWLFFLGMNIIPIYSFSLFIDVLFGNSVEFWTGDNPITARFEGTRVARGEDGSVMRATWLAHDRLHLERVDPDGTRHVLVISRTDRGAEARDAAGQLLGRVVEGSGGLRFVAGS